MKKFYLLVGILVLAIAVVFGIYWYLQQRSTTNISSVSTEEKVLGAETENFSQDIDDLEIAGQDKNLETLDNDLSAIAGEIPLGQKLAPTESSVATISDLESAESDLSVEVDSISSDLVDLNSFEEDSSLNGLDNSLSGVAQ